MTQGLPPGPGSLVFNGINGATGGYLLSPMDLREISAIALEEPHDKEHQYDLNLRLRRSSKKVRGVKEGVDPKCLASAGWGVIFAYTDQARVPAIKEALGELLNLRRKQAGDRYKEFNDVDAYRPDESKSNFLARQKMGPGPADPEKVPYYLLIVGDPETIPYTFQYQLDVQYAVGRIFFDNLDEYASYARSVVETETGNLSLPHLATFLGVQNQDDQATILSATQLVQPLAEKIAAASGETDWTVKVIYGEGTTKPALAELIGGERTPALLFTASHGMGFPNGDLRQLPHQGALLCQDWPGPRAWKEPIPEDFYYSAGDVSSDAHLSGSIAFHFACYGAGTPRMDEFAHFANRGTAAIAEKAFVSCLPQRLLGHPNGGMLAVVGHVERAWGYSFAWENAGSQVGVFESAIRRLMKGSPVGYALEYFNERYAELSTELSASLQGVRFGKKIDELELAGMWTANNDARSYVILGDPAVHFQEGESQIAQKRKGSEAIVISSETGIQDLREGVHEVDGIFKTLQKLSTNEVPVERAKALLSFASALTGYPVGNREESLKMAIEVYESALNSLQVVEDRSLETRIQGRLARCYLEIYGWTEEQSYAGKAEKLFQRLIELYEAAGKRSDWAAENLNLAVLYAQIYERGGGEALARKARRATENALTIFTREDSPLTWAMTHSLLANLMLNAVDIDEADKAAAISHLQAALEVIDADVFPHQYEKLQVKLKRILNG